MVSCCCPTLRIMGNELKSEHQFYYQTESPVTARMLAESLLGLEGVVERSSEIIGRLIPEIGRLDAEVLITSIELGSYKENFIVRLIFGKGEEAEKRIDQLRKKLGLHKMDSKKLVGFAIAAAILYAAYLYSKKGEGAKPEATVHIENSFNTIGSEMNLSREEVLALIETAITNKEDLKKHVVRLMHPANEAKGGKVLIDENETFAIPKEVVEVVPNHYEKEEADEPVKDFDNIQMVVRAADLDKVTQGWAAIIAEVSDKRLPLHVMPEVDVNKVPVGKYFQGNITVVYKVDKKGNKTPKRYLLRGIQAE